MAVPPRNRPFAKAEMAEALVLLTVVAGFYLVTFRFSDPLLTMEGIPSPAAIPRLILGMLAASAVLRMWLAVTGRGGARFETPDLPRVGATAAIAIAYVVAAAWAGLLLPIPVFVAGLAWIWGGRSVPRLAAMALGVPVFVWVFFDLLFRAQLPLWPWN